MRYKHDTLLPIGAFKRQGSVVGGRSMRLHGGDSWYTQEEDPQGYWVGGGSGEGNDTSSYFVPYEPSPAPPPPLAAPAAAPVYTPPPPAAAPAPEAPKGYSIEEEYTDAGPRYTLVDPQGNQIADVKAEKDDGGGIIGYGILHSGSGDSGSDSVVPIDLGAISARAEKGVVPFGTGMGPALGYEYGMKNSSGNIFRKFDAQGNLTEFLDEHEQWQPASTFQPAGLEFNSLTGNFETTYTSPNSKRVNIRESTANTVNRYAPTSGGWIDWGRMAGLVAAGLSAGVAGGAFAGLGLGAAPVTGTVGALSAAIPAANPILTAAVQGALLGTATSGLQGAEPADMLKSALIGGISAGAGSAISGAGLGTVGNIAARTGLQTGLTAISGGDVGQAAISGIINGVLPVALTEILPADTMSAFNSLPDSVKKIVMGTAGSVLNAGFNGQDISDAATNGVVNGMISLGKDLAKGAFNDLKESDLAQTVKGYFNPSSTAGDFTGTYEDSVATLPDDTDVVNRIFQQDADEAFNRNVPPPLVQETINLNTPVTAETVTTPPPLIQTAMGQTNPDDVYNQLVDAFGNPQVGAPLSTLASATTSDSIITLPDGTRQLVVGDDKKGVRIGDDSAQGRLAVDEQSLSLFNEILQDEGYSDLMATSLDDKRLVDFVNRANERIESSNAMSLPSPESTASAIDAFVQAGGDTRAISSVEGTQSPEYAVTEAFKAFFGRNPTDIELNTFAPSGAERLAPQEYLKNVFDYAQQEKQQEQQATFVEFVQPPPLVQEAINQNVKQVEPEKVEPQKVEPVKEDKKDTKAGGSGTQGGSLAGDEGRVGAAAPLATAAPSESAYGATKEFQALDVAQTTAIESQSVASELASLGAIEPADIPIVTANLNQSSRVLNVTPTVAVTNGLVTNQGTLSDKGVEKVASDTGLSTADVENAVQGSSTIEAGTGSGVKGDGTGGAKGDGTGVSGDEGLGGRTGEGVGGQGTGVGTGVGAGEGTGSGGGLPSFGGSYGGARLTLNPQFPGALPGALEGTYLKGVEVDEYDPFANYNVYQQLEPIRAAQGGSPLQLMQMQQGIVGYDPSSYRNVQFRPMPDYFTYGSKPQQPTTFAGSQLMGKPKPSIPVTPTGKVGSTDWLYGTAGSNQLSPAGAALPPLASGMMANGGQAQQNDQDEHIPEFITGKTGNYVKGRGTGQSDEIPAMLADGEWVADADVVAALGDGSSDAGAELLDAFRHVIRDHKRSAPSDKIPPAASPLAYMKEALQRTGRLK